MTDKPQELTQDDARNLARWENEGGASKRDRTQKTPNGLEIPVPHQLRRRPKLLGGSAESRRPRPSKD